MTYRDDKQRRRDAGGRRGGIRRPGGGFISQESLVGLLRETLVIATAGKYILTPATYVLKIAMKTSSTTLMFPSVTMKDISELSVG